MHFGELQQVSMNSEHLTHYAGALNFSHYRHSSVAEYTNPQEWPSSLNMVQTSLALGLKKYSFTPPPGHSFTHFFSILMPIKVSDTIYIH